MVHIATLPGAVTTVAVRSAMGIRVPARSGVRMAVVQRGVVAVVTSYRPGPPPILACTALHCRGAR